MQTVQDWTVKVAPFAKQESCSYFNTGSEFKIAFAAAQETVRRIGSEAVNSRPINLPNHGDHYYHWIEVWSMRWRVSVIAEVRGDQGIVAIIAVVPKHKIKEVAERLWKTHRVCRTRR